MRTPGSIFISMPLSSARLRSVSACHSFLRRSVMLFDRCSEHLVVVSCCACLQAMRSHCPPSKGMGAWSAVFWSASHVVHLTILAPLFTFSALLLPLLLQVLILCPLCTHCACACMLRRHASEIFFPPSPFTCGPFAAGGSEHHPSNPSTNRRAQNSQVSLPQCVKCVTRGPRGITTTHRC